MWRCSTGRAISSPSTNRGAGSPLKKTTAGMDSPLPTRALASTTGQFAARPVARGLKMHRPCSRASTQCWRAGRSPSPMNMLATRPRSHAGSASSSPPSVTGRAARSSRTPISPLPGNWRSNCATNGTALPGSPPQCLASSVLSAAGQTATPVSPTPARLFRTCMACVPRLWPNPPPPCGR